MLQGDEPMIHPDMIESAVKPLVDDIDISVSNLISKINTEKEWHDPNEVKVVKDLFNNAVLFL